MDNLTLEINFRFRQLNKMQVLTLCRELDGVSYTENTQDVAPHQPQLFIALVALSSGNLEAITMFYVRQGMDVSNCDILVTAKLAAATRFTLPVIVNQMLRHIDCPVSFSLCS